jgi:hypothetical protein
MNLDITSFKTPLVPPCKCDSRVLSALAPLGTGDHRIVQPMESASVNVPRLIVRGTIQ